MPTRPVRFHSAVQSFQQIWNATVCLAGAGRHREQETLASGEHGVYYTVNGDLLVIARVLAADEVERRQEPCRVFVRQFPARAVAFPQFVRRRKIVADGFEAGEAVELDDPVPVRAVREG